MRCIGLYGRKVNPLVRDLLNDEASDAPEVLT